MVEVIYFMKKQPINDGTDYHYITEDGKVLSYYKNKWKQLKTCLSREGYEHIKLNKKDYKVHRLVALAFIPNPENKEQVNHIDGNKLNNCVDNLEWCDNSYNQKHAWDLGLQQKRHPINCKLSQEEADNVRHLYLIGASTNELAKMYNVSKTTIKDIINGKYYNLNKDIQKISRDKTSRKLTFEEAEEIRYFYNRYKPSYSELAKCYEVNHKTIISIINYKKYKKKCND